MKRIAVFGNAGGEKSTLARRIAAATELPLYVIDQLQFRPGGAEVPRDEYLRIHAELLRRVAVLLNERVDLIAEVMAHETGKAIKDCRGEVARSQDTMQLSAEEAVRIEGEQVPLDGSAMGAGKIAFRSDMADGDRNVAAVFMQILTDPQAMTEEKANQLVEQAIGEEIESVLKHGSLLPPSRRRL